MMTPALDKKYLTRLTWWTRFSKAKFYDYEDISKAHKAARQSESSTGKNDAKNGKKGSKICVKFRLWTLLHESKPS